MSGVRTLHVLMEVPFNGADNIELKITMQGLKRLKPHAVRQAAPLSPQILCKIYGLLDTTRPFEATRWSLLLTAFFTLSRKSNLVVTGAKRFDMDRQLCRSDVLIGDNGLLVQFRWRKAKAPKYRRHCYLVSIHFKFLKELNRYRLSFVRLLFHTT